MPDSPRVRRLRNDHKALEQLAAESSIFSFRAYGTPPDFYMLRFKGRGVWRYEGEVLVRDEHEIHIRLGASYPRMMPELAWKSPVFHPNVSASGVVCLGGYGTYWVPSLSLDELCVMLWDMIRYENFDEKSPYNREAAAWARRQTTFRLPIDQRPLRDRLCSAHAMDRILPQSAAPPMDLAAGDLPSQASGLPPRRVAVASPTSRAVPADVPEVVFLGEVVRSNAAPRSPGSTASDILFIE